MSGVILCLEVRESCSFYLYIYIFCDIVLFLTVVWFHVFLSDANNLGNLPVIRYPYLIQKTCAWMYGFKYFYLIQVICTQ